MKVYLKKKNYKETFSLDKNNERNFLDLRFQQHISDITLKDIIENSSSISNVIFFKNNHLTSGGIINFFENSTSITSINFYSLIVLDNTILEHVIKTMSIKYLSIIGCYNLKNVNMSLILSSTSLIEFKLNNYENNIIFVEPNVVNKSIIQIFLDNVNITNENLVFLINSCDSLKKIVIKFCNNIDIDYLKEFITKNILIEIVYSQNSIFYRKYITEDIISNNKLTKLFPSNFKIFSGV